MENLYETLSSCGCVGYAYVPVQVLSNTYDTAMALNKGTVFSELDLNICEYGKVCKKVGAV